MTPEKLSDYKSIYQHPKFREEFERVMHEPSARGRYHKWLRQKLALLDSMGYSVLKLPDFEPLGLRNKKLISIRYPRSQKNPRVLMVFFDGDKVLLLCTFLESSKKQNSDYQMAIAKAENRLNELKAGD